jgi:hypothetical protein
MRIFIPILLAICACSAEKKSSEDPKPFSCPTEISSKTVLPPGSKTYGKLVGLKVLYHTGLATGQPEEAMPQGFAEEITEEWENAPDGSEQDIEEYSPNKHPELNLMCDYLPKSKYDARVGFDKAEGRVTLLIPLPDSVGLNCTLKRNPDIDKYSAVCIVK